MSDKIKVDQNLSGEGGTQIAVQNNYGLTPAQACDLAMSMFREYYPRLREECLTTLEKLFYERMEGVPPENIVPPKAKIVVPVLQNASITEEEELQKMYASLLASSVNREKNDNVHPAYVEIINQLCADEAKILAYINKLGSIPILSVRFENKNGEGYNVLTNFSNIGELTNCEQPSLISSYLDNLVRLGLIEHPALRKLTDERLYDGLKLHHSVQNIIKTVDQYGEYNTVNYVYEYVCITDFGKGFCKVCIGK